MRSSSRLNEGDLAITAREPGPAKQRGPRSSLDLPVSALPGVGEGAEKLLERLDIRTIGELLWHLPRT
ncbi:MAG TPA: hypothetical protein VM052_02875, partial [Candidatus Limnocylindrales bacterium]|nr:hypothetical protein [Candidatus Limnocylindrales bacterium]